MNPQGTVVAAFKQPSSVEAAHDFLWRVHEHAPGKGEVVIFNRSHYEDVLVTRVHDLVPKSGWSRKAISSASPPIRSGCWRTMLPTRISCSRRVVATR